MSPTRTWIVTGGNAGLGFQCCRFLAQQPSSLIVIPCRDARKGDAAAERLRREGGAAEVLPLDLNALGAVRAFVEAFRRADLPPLAGIVCNAGVQIITAPTQTADRFETTFGVNHLAHYLLVRLLLDDLGAGGSIVFVSSNTHDPQQKTGFPEPRFDGAQAVAHDLEPGADAGRRRYTTSKLCNIYCTYELARQLDQSGDPRLQSIYVNAFDPGMMPGTGLARTYPAPFASFGTMYFRRSRSFRRMSTAPPHPAAVLRPWRAVKWVGSRGSMSRWGRPSPLPPCRKMRVRRGSCGKSAPR